MSSSRHLLSSLVVSMITLLLLLLRPMLLLAAAWHGGTHRHWLSRSGNTCRCGKNQGGAGQRRQRRRLAEQQPTCQRILQRICCRWLLLLLLPAESLEHGVRGLLALSAARLAAAARASKGCGPQASARRPDWPAEAQAQPARSCNLLHGCVDWQLRLAVLRERRWAGKQPPERPMQAACWRPPQRVAATPMRSLSRGLPAATQAWGSGCRLPADRRQRAACRGQPEGTQRSAVRSASCVEDLAAQRSAPGTPPPLAPPVPRLQRPYTR